MDFIKEGFTESISAICRKERVEYTDLERYFKKIRAEIRTDRQHGHIEEEQMKIDLAYKLANQLINSDVISFENFSMFNQTYQCEETHWTAQINITDTVNFRKDLRSADFI